MSAKRTPKEGAAASSLQNMLTKGRKRKGRDSDEESDYRLRLSEYEKNRPRIEALPDASPITIEWKALKEEFTCPVCRGLLDRTMITVECMHRFCFNCIRDALFKGNKQCPTCRRECPAMRNLRHDERFDQMIQVLFGGPQEANEDIINTEEIVARRMAEVRRMYEEGMKKQAERRKSRAGSSSGHRRPRENSHGYSDNDTEDDFENADMSSASETEESFLQSRQRASHVDEVDGIWPLDGFEEPDSKSPLCRTLPMTGFPSVKLSVYAPWTTAPSPISYWCCNNIIYNITQNWWKS
ncbi:hypothetical protein BC832DRAFT_288864 [Gaertneriomyces semiglobifer]|nr:hypothetical protein BC832DRAFT_288864 [Gaertneriomyces semiglobifer]